MAYTVMIVDDSETIRLVVRQSLSISKLPVDSVIYAVNGRDALEKLRAKWVDIVFSDINMPEMTGIELLETMQADPELKLIPIIIVSSEASTVRLDEIMKKGAKGYLRKPFAPEQLKEVVINTLGTWD